MFCSEAFGISSVETELKVRLRPKKETALQSVSGLLFVLLRDVDRLSAVEEVLSLYVAGHLCEELLDQRISHLEGAPQDSVRLLL